MLEGLLVPLLFLVLLVLLGVGVLGEGVVVVLLVLLVLLGADGDGADFGPSLPQAATMTVAPSGSALPPRPPRSTK